MEKVKQIEAALGDIGSEYLRAVKKHQPMVNAHEGWAVLLEEVDELWDEVKKQKRDPEKLRKEAVQVGAMALRFILDICEREEKTLANVFGKERGDER